MDESLEGLEWLIATLAAITGVSSVMTGGIYPMQAPQGIAPPFLVVTPMGGSDVLAVAGYRKMYEGTFQVRLWGYATASDALKGANKAADAGLHQSKHKIAPSAQAEILSCNRDYPLPPLPEWDGQQLRIGIGGLYRLQIRSLS